MHIIYVGLKIQETGINVSYVKFPDCITFQAIYRAQRPEPNSLGKSTFSTGLFKMIVGVKLSSGNSAPNSGNNNHLTIPFEGGMHIFKRQGACISRN